jgi:hypothetical protein
LEDGDRLTVFFNRNGFSEDWTVLQVLDIKNGLSQDLDYPRFTGLGFFMETFS